jgi:hypothetical protein
MAAQMIPDSCPLRFQSEAGLALPLRANAKITHGFGFYDYLLIVTFHATTVAYNMTKGKGKIAESADFRVRLAWPRKRGSDEPEFL